MSANQQSRIRWFVWSIVIAGGFLFVLITIVFPAMSTQTAAAYTRRGVEWYEERRAEASNGDLAQAAQSLNSVLEYRPSTVPSEGNFAHI